MTLITTPALAIDGGLPVRKRPFAPWPHFGDEEIEAVNDVLRSGRVNYWTGETCRAFEAEFAETVGCRRAVAVANGTLALELALEALGIGPGDDVVVTSRTFIATASCVVARGARPIVADVDADSGNVTAATIEAALTPRTRAVIVVHLAGWPCELDEILALADRRGLYVIEDCAQALGATYRGRPVGSFGHAAAFSFCQDKILTTGGEGGMLTTDDEALFRRAWSYKDHGKSYEAVYERAHPPGFRWLHERFGSNWRMTEMQAAIGRVALTRLPGWLEIRRGHAERLLGRLQALPALRVPRAPEYTGHAYYKLYAYVRPETLRPGWSRDRVLDAIAAEGVPCFSGSCSEIYREAAFTRWRPATRLPTARWLGETALMFLVHPTLDSADLDAVAEAVEKVLAVATRPERR